MDKIKVKVRPAGTNVKVQYEGEELTIKELVGKLEYLKGSQEYLKWAVVEKEKEIALLKKQLADVQSVRSGRWIDADELQIKIASLSKPARPDTQKSLLGRVLYIIDQMPTITMPQWIRAEERLPEEEQDV